MKSTKKDYYDTYLCVEKAWEKANNTSSWSGKIEPSPVYTKATKEFFNAVVAEYLFLKNISLEDDKTLSQERLKCHIVKRIFRKGELWDIKPNEKTYLERHGMKDADVYQYMYKAVNDNYPGAVWYLDYVFSQELTLKEMELFEVAKFTATKIEFEAIKSQMTKVNREETQKEIDRKEKDIHLCDYLDDEELRWFEKLSDASRIGRWAKFPKNFVMTDSAHMMLTALFSDLITKEFVELNKTDVDSTKAFFVALFHDIIEVWTGDAPSPCKDELFFATVQSYLRKVYEEFEEYMYKKYFYRYMDPVLAEKFKEDVVFEEGADDLSQIIKNADYFSADWEVYLTIKTGLVDKAYFSIIEKSYNKSQRNAQNGYNGTLRERTPAATQILADMYDYTSTIRLPKI